MKTTTTLFLTIVLVALVQPAHARVLQAGESFVLQFTNLPYVAPTDATPPERFYFYITQLRPSSDSGFHIELFADSTSQPPFFAQDYFYGQGGYYEIGYGGFGNSWSDFQGMVRFTSISGIVDVAAIRITVAKNGAQYQQTFAIPPIAPPLISLQPSNITAIAGSSLTLSADGYGMPLSLQWQRNGTNIVGATNGVLALPNAQIADSAAYRAVLTNSAGASTTTVANVVIQFGTELELQFRPVLTLRGSTGSTYRIEYSVDLSSGSWMQLTNIALDSSPYYFIDTQAPSPQRRFYRAVSIP